MNLFLFELPWLSYLLKTDTVWSVAGIHGAWNFAQGNLCGILVSGQQSGTSLMTFYHKVIKIGYQGGSFGIEGSYHDKSGLATADSLPRLSIKERNERM